MIASSLTAFFEFQRHRLILWCPVWFAVGIGLYFSGKYEPSITFIIVVSILAVICLISVRRNHFLRMLILLSLSFVCLGYSYTAVRSKVADTYVMKRHYYGPIYGRIVGLDRSSTNYPRVTLDNVYLPGFGDGETPEKIRISLQGFIPDNTLIPGDQIALTGSVSPPSPPAEPNGFDFRRLARFMGLGGVGYTRNPVMPVKQTLQDTLQVKLFDIRMNISAKIKASIASQNGAFAAAIITGDRSDIDPFVLEDLRSSNLAHLLAISGLHMGLLSGFIFALVRYGLASVSSISLRYPIKKIAAGSAIFAGSYYLLLSGANVATQRAFIMTTVVLMAVILDRPAFTLRAVALAAFVVLLLKPYSLLEAGFQMSFAATTSLISAYEWLQTKRFWGLLSGDKYRFLKPVVALVFTSFIAGASTAPISAFHFNQVSQFGLVANVFAVPVMALVVMPSSVIAIALSSIGLEAIPFNVMGMGIGYILEVAKYFASLDNSVSTIKSAPTLVLSLVAIGGVVLTTAIGRARILGASSILVAIGLWYASHRPALIIDGQGQTFGVLTDAGRAINKDRGNGYGVRIWLENDGDNYSQKEAFEREGIVHLKDYSVASLPENWKVRHYKGDSTQTALKLCEEKTILILPKIRFEADDCTIIDKEYLSQSGAISVDIRDGYPEVKNSRASARYRPWGTDQ